MMQDTFRAVLLDGDGQGGVQEMGPHQLPDGDVTIRVAYSSLNYKDGLALRGKARVVRSYPMIPGIDLAGTVEASSSPLAPVGTPVAVTGWGMGETHWGGYTQMERVDGGMTVPLPEVFDPRAAMAIGTAGLTAILAVMALQEHDVRPEGGPVVVTGASGGVGSLAVALLGRLGYTTVASTGRQEYAEYLRGLGASEVIGRDELSAPSNRPLETGRWAGGVDTVGSATLAGLLRQTAQHGSIAVCGNAGGHDLPTTVLPFILRGVNLLGIDSNYCPRERRLQAWDRLAHDLPTALLEEMTEEAGLDNLTNLADRILGGQIRGRVVVNVNA